MKNQGKFKQTEIGMIPEDWSIGRLGDNAEKIFVGRDPTGGKQSHSKDMTGYHIVQSAPVFDGFLDVDKIGYVSEKLYLNLESASVKEDDVLLNQLGDGITFARSCVVPKGILPAIITRSVGCIRCDPNKLFSWFLNAYLVISRTKKYIESFNSGSSRRAIDGGKMRSFVIPLPPMKEQKKIGLFYKTIQDKIELNKKMNKTLEGICNAIFKQWFIDFEFPNKKNTFYKSSGGEMIYNENLGKAIPEGWEFCPLGNTLSLLKDGSHNPPKRVKEGIRFIAGASDLRHFIINFERCTYITKEDYEEFHKKWLVQPKDVLLTIVGTVGNVAIVRKDDLPFSLQRSIAVMRPNEKINYVYLYFLLNTKFFKNQIKMRINPTAQPGIYLTELSRIKIILPSKNTLDQFYKITKPLVERMQENFKEIETLTITRDSLLPKLMSGKIRVPVEVRK